MKANKMIILSLALLWIIVDDLDAQNPCNNTDCYMAALAYLRVDPVFDNLLNTTFGTKKRKSKPVSLSVSDWIRFIPLGAHESTITTDSILSNCEVLNLDRRDFYALFSFSSNSCQYLSNFRDQPLSNATIVFSKPFDKYLLAEVLDKKLSSNGNVRNGKAISILFSFQDGFVDRCFYNVIIF